MFKRCIVFLFDGARYDVFCDLLANGELPQIEKGILANGTFLKGVSSLSTTTGPAHIPYIFGTHPGNANVPGIRWYEKSKRKSRSYVGAGCFKMYTDVSRVYMPIYKFFADPVGIFSSLDGMHVREHIRHQIQKSLFYVLAHYTKRWKMVDKAAARSVRRQIKRGRDFIFSVFPGIDEITHEHHPEHRAVIDQYREMDRLVGEMLADVEDTLLFLVSDHGLTETHTHVSLVELAQAEGYKPLFYPKIFPRDYDIVIMESGNALAFVYFMKPVSRRPGMYSEITALAQNRAFIERLLANDGIECIAYRKNNACIGVRNEHGEGFLRGEYLRQLRQLFNSDRTGDLVVFAKEGFDLRGKHEWPEHHSSHGSMAHTDVPICTNIKLESQTCRTVDVFPTILNQLGRAIPENIDGVVLQ